MYWIKVFFLVRIQKKWVYCIHTQHTRKQCAIVMCQCGWIRPNFLSFCIHPNRTYRQYIRVLYLSNRSNYLVYLNIHHQLLDTHYLYIIIFLDGWMDELCVCVCMCIEMKWNEMVFCFVFLLLQTIIHCMFCVCVCQTQMNEKREKMGLIFTRKKIFIHTMNLCGWTVCFLKVVWNKTFFFFGPKWLKLDFFSDYKLCDIVDFYGSNLHSFIHSLPSV